MSEENEEMPRGNEGEETGSSSGSSSGSSRAHPSHYHDENVQQRGSPRIFRWRGRGSLWLHRGRRQSPSTSRPTLPMSPRGPGGDGIWFYGRDLLRRYQDRQRRRLALQVQRGARHVGDGMVELAQLNDDMQAQNLRRRRLALQLLRRVRQAENRMIELRQQAARQAQNQMEEQLPEQQDQ